MYMHQTCTKHSYLQISDKCVCKCTKHAPNIHIHKFQTHMHVHAYAPNIIFKFQIYVCVHATNIHQKENMHHTLPK